MEMSVAIHGLDELKKKLDKLPGRVQKNILTSAMRAGANVVKKEAQSRAPEDTGNLKKSITVKKKRIRSRYLIVFKVVTGKVRSTKKGAVTIHDGYYGRFVEIGTSKMPPHPFLRPAFEICKEQIIGAVADKLRQRLDNEVGKL